MLVDLDPLPLNQIAPEDLADALKTEPAMRWKVVVVNACYSGGFVDALREQDLKVGLYYSLPDWSHPDYDVFTRKQKRYETDAEPERWQRFLRYYQGQVQDIADRYNPDLYWFDGDWEHDADTWQAAQVPLISLPFSRSTATAPPTNAKAAKSPAQS